MSLILARGADLPLEWSLSVMAALKTAPLSDQSHIMPHRLSGLATLIIRPGELLAMEVGLMFLAKLA